METWRLDGDARPIHRRIGAQRDGADIGAAAGIGHDVFKLHGSRCHGSSRPAPDYRSRRPTRAWGAPSVSAMADPQQPAGPSDPLLEIYLERRANLIRFFAARTGSTTLAEDLAQDLYLKLAARDPTDAPVENPVALIYRIATNVMLDRTRGEARAGARDAAWRRLSHASVGGEDVAGEPPADEAVASRQRLNQLVDAVADLPPQMQRAFRLHKLEGLSHADTARTMGISVKSVEKHISAALKTLTVRLGR